MNCKALFVLSVSIAVCITAPVQDIDNFIEMFTSNFDESSVVFISPVIGQDLKLECAFTQNNQDITWSALLNKTNVRYSSEDIHETDEASFLTIRNITDKSMGDYYCDRGFDWVSFFIMPKRMKAFIGSSQSQTVKRGNDVEITCDGHPRGFVSPRWMIRGKSGTEMNSRLTMVRNKAIIEDFSEEDEGIYECTFKTMFRERFSMFIRLRLENNTNITSRMLNQSIGFVPDSTFSWIFPQIGQSFQLECSIPENINTSFWGRDINENHVIPLNFTEKNNSLILTFVDFDETMYGSFSCFHDDIQIDTFFVSPFPQISSLTQPDADDSHTPLHFPKVQRVHLSDNTTLANINMTTSSNVAEFTNITLTCSTETHLSDEIGWFHDSFPLEMISSTEAVVENFSKNHSGFYECRIKTVFNEKVSLFISLNVF
jgi:hypothetical protein